LELLKKSLIAYEDSYQYFLSLRKSLANDASIEDLSRTRIGFLGRASQVAHQLYSQTQERDYLDRAYSFSESLKAFSFRQGAFRQIYQLEKQNTQSLKLQALLNEEFSYTDQIKEIEAALAADPSNNKLTQQLIQLNEQYRAFVNRLAQSKRISDQRYYSDRLQNSTLSLNETREQLLNEKTVLIEFQLGDREGLTFVQTLDTIAFIKWPADSTFYSTLEAYRNSLQQVDDNFAVYAHQLYKILFQPIEALLPDKVDNILIIPTARLSQIAFESLLSKTSGQSYETADFLVNRYSFSYHYSATSLYQHRRLRAMRSEGKEGLQILSTSLSDEQSCGTQLIALDKLSQQLTRNNDEIIIINQAEKDDLEAASNASILQLNMHGCKNSKGAYYLELQKGAVPSPLYLGEAYTYQVAPDLLILANCESGNGNLVMGEGVFSMARPFLYNGTGGVMATLSVVPDAATASILQLFYNEIAKGTVNLHQALTTAKRSYLKNGQNPYPWYWANLIYLGDPDLSVQVSMKGARQI